MMQIVPMTVEQALKASETYASPINGDMVIVLAAEGRRLQRHVCRKYIAFNMQLACECCGQMFDSHLRPEPPYECSPIDAKDE